MTRNQFYTLPSIIVLVALCVTARASNYTTSLGVPNTFVNPAGWAVGSAESTYQEWNVRVPPGSAGGLPIDAPPDDPAGLGTVTSGSPTHSAKPPYFGPSTGFTGGALLTSTGNYYAFSPPATDPTAVFGATADIFNAPGSFGPTFGTHVIIQTGSSLNDGVGNFTETMKIVDLADAPIAGGDNAEALQISQGTKYTDVPSAFGEVDYAEYIYEVFLPGYTGDFRVDWDQAYNASIDTLRVDSKIAEAPFALTEVTQTTIAFVPEPSTTSLAVLGSLLAVRVRRRRTRGRRLGP